MGQRGAEALLGPVGLLHRVGVFLKVVENVGGNFVAIFDGLNEPVCLLDFFIVFVL